MGVHLPHDPIDFTSLAAALLDRAERIVPEWLPGGRQVAGEWVCGSLEGGEGRSCSVNLRTGKWADFSSDDRGNDLISLYAAVQGLGQVDAARQLMDQLGWRRASTMPAPVHASGRATEGDGRPEPPPIDEDPAGSQRRSGKRERLWRSVLPIPAFAPQPDFKHFHRGLPQHRWEYRFENEFFGYVCRFETSDGGKEILPYTWCVDDSDGRGTQMWQWRQWDEPRPLYVPATLLSGDRTLPVVIVEGEKCAMAGHQLLGHEFDFVSWPGGWKAWAKARWAWLMNRTVYLWPDCDAKRVPLSKTERDAGMDAASKPIKPLAKQPGVQAMVGIGSLLLAEHGCEVFLCEIPKPGDVSDGWDIADAIASGWDAEMVRNFIAGRIPSSAGRLPSRS
jgi:putative DNA primase/helicase